MAAVGICCGGCWNTLCCGVVLAVGICCDVVVSVGACCGSCWNMLWWLLEYVVVLCWLLEYVVAAVGICCGGGVVVAVRDLPFMVNQYQSHNQTILPNRFFIDVSSI